MMTTAPDWELHPDQSEKANPWKSILLGAAAGLGATFLMNAYLAHTSELAEDLEDSLQFFDEDSSLNSIALVGPLYREGEDSTKAIGRIVYNLLTGEDPKSSETRQLLSELVHFDFGASMGALYGLWRSGADFPDLRKGLLFGAAVWLLASETAIPLMGLAPGPAEVPETQHLNHLLAHLVYGLATAVLFQAARRIV